MKLKEIYEIADGLAPFALSKEYCEKYGAHDNSGVILDCGKEIDAILFSLDLSPEAAREAADRGCGLIFTHHPAIFTGIMRLGSGDPLFACAQAGISVISAHLNLDCAEGGIDEQLMCGLGGKAESAPVRRIGFMEKFSPAAKSVQVMEKLSSGGYGRVYPVAQTTTEELCGRLAEQFGAKRVISYGTRTVRKLASFCGAGLTEEAIRFANENGADTVVSSDAKHHLVELALRLDLNLVLPTHYCAENYGFLRFAERFSRQAKGVRCETFTDERFL